MVFCAARQPRRRSAGSTSHTAAFVQRLRELGWAEGRNVAIEYRWAEGRQKRYANIAGEFVRLKVDVIVSYATAPVIAAKKRVNYSDCVRDGGRPARHAAHPIWHDCYARGWV